MVIIQKRLNFGMKRNCKIQDNMGGNGLGNRCSILASKWTQVPKTFHRWGLIVNSPISLPA